MDAEAVVPNWLTRRSQTHGNTIAVWHQDGTWTYRELWERATNLAAALKCRVPTQGTVGILVRNGLFFALSVHACVQAEYCMVPLNARLTAQELAYQIDDAGIALLLVDDDYSGVASAALDFSVSSAATFNVSRENASRGEFSSTATPLDRPLCVIYTSGTTGRPKGAILTYGNFLASATASAIQLGLAQSDNWLVPMPLYHVGGLSVLIRSVIYGTTVSIMDKFEEHIVSDYLDSANVTLLSVVPTMLRRLLNHRSGKPAPNTLRTVLLGGSAADQSLLEECQRLGWPVAQSYGLTEATSQVCTLSVEDGLNKLGSSGLPLLFTDVRIVNEEGIPVNHGQSGEIVIRGQTVSPGYLKRDIRRDPAEWFQTGDMGYFDQQGYLYVLDRRTDMIVSGGENIYPAEVESVLLSHPGVAEAGVVGMDDASWGQVPVAFVRLHPNAQTTESDLLSYGLTRLAKYKVPVRIVFLDELPRNASGKLLRRTLRTWL